MLGTSWNRAWLAVQAALGADKVTFEQGVYLDNYGADWQMENAAKACEGADAAVIFLGLSSIKDHRIPKPDFLQVDESWARPTALGKVRVMVGVTHTLRTSATRSTRANPTYCAAISLRRACSKEWATSFGGCAAQILKYLSVLQSYDAPRILQLLASLCERADQGSWVHAQGSFDIHSQHTESEGYDRSSLELPGMQETFVRLLARLTPTPLIVVLVHGALQGATCSRVQRPKRGTFSSTWK